MFYKRTTQWLLQPLPKFVFLPWTTRRCCNIGRVWSRSRSNGRARSWAWTTLRFKFRFSQRGRSVSFAFAFRDSQIFLRVKTFLRAEICFEPWIEPWRRLALKGVWLGQSGKPEIVSYSKHLNTGQVRYSNVLGWYALPLFLFVMLKCAFCLSVPEP